MLTSLDSQRKTAIPTNKASRRWQKSPIGIREAAHQGLRRITHPPRKRSSLLAFWGPPYGIHLPVQTKPAYSPGRFFGHVFATCLAIQATSPRKGWHRSNSDGSNPECTDFLREVTSFFHRSDTKADPPVPAVIPVSKSTWWDGVKSGRFPKPVKLGPRITAWRVEDIRGLIDVLSNRLSTASAPATGGPAK
jgi:prophage regulatory protein